MAPNPRRLDARLDALYEQIPAIQCQGLCYDSCGVIACSVREQRRAEEAAGGTALTTQDDDVTCSLLSEGGRCTAYEARPLICRLWGVAEGMPCPYGCKPERYLTPMETVVMMAEADEIGGVHAGRADELKRAIARATESLSREKLNEQLGDVAGGKRNPKATLAGRALTKQPWERDQ